MCALYSDSANLRWPATALKINKHDLTVLVQRGSEKPLTVLPGSSRLLAARRNYLGSVSADAGPTHRSCLGRYSRLSPAQNLPRKTRLRTLTGRQKVQGGPL